jgi:hypothetical protein
VTTPADDRTAIMLLCRPCDDPREMRSCWAPEPVLTGAATGDTAAMRAAATTAGMKAAVDVNPAISALLPKEFLRSVRDTRRIR